MLGPWCLTLCACFLKLFLGVDRGFQENLLWFQEKKSVRVLNRTLTEWWDWVLEAQGLGGFLGTTIMHYKKLAQERRLASLSTYNEMKEEELKEGIESSPSPGEKISFSLLD